MKVAVLGLGLIGGSVALGALAQGVAVTGWDPDSDTCHRAAQAGVVIATEPSRAVAGASLVLLCGPLKTLGYTARLIKPHLAADAVVTDVGSVKAAVRDSLAQEGITSQYVGAHPMAGTESAGFSAATAQLLHGVTWAVTIDHDTQQANFFQLVSFLTTVFSAQVIVLDDRAHDEAAALISHVPHILAHGLLGTAAGSMHATVAKRLAAGSFRDGTRVARLNPSRNQAMVEDNREAVAATLKDLVHDLTALIKDLEQGRPSDLFFNRSAQWSSYTPDQGTLQNISADTWRSQVLALGSRGSLITAIKPGTHHGFEVTVRSADV